MTQELDFDPDKTAALEKEWGRKLDFNVTLPGGEEVRVHFEYMSRAVPHIEMFGEATSSTGYRSHFPGHGAMDMDDTALKAWCGDLCRKFKELEDAERAKEARRRRRA